MQSEAASWHHHSLVLLLPNLQNYLTSQVLEIVTTAGAHLQAIQTVMQRCASVGVSRPSEGTFAMITAVVVAIREPTASAHSMYAMFMDCKRLKSSVKSTLSTRDLAVFPADPAQLPPEVCAVAYTGVLPEARDVPRLAEIATRCPRRKTNRQLRGC